ADHADEVVEQLKATVPEITGNIAATYDQENNDVFRDRASDAFWYDYAVYSDEHMQPTRTALTAVRPRASPFLVCMTAISISPAYPESRLCVTDTTITDLS
ncbi:hypothetical protein, partial [Salmonella sp. s54395]|uniref:hypothetical protein n=1 Tax=Salmonella sp. s54395 TaxID=3159664 RepID=UPI0039804EF9